jgi:hypothetical protein
MPLRAENHGFLLDWTAGNVFCQCCHTVILNISHAIAIHIESEGHKAKLDNWNML